MAPLRHNRLLKEMVFHAVVFVLTLIGVTVVLQLWKTSLSRPFSYGGGDELFMASLAKSVMETGWYLKTPYLGMPFGHDLSPFPLADSFNFAIFRLLALASSHWPLVINIFYLGTFPAIALSSAFVLRRLGAGMIEAASAGILFAFLPYHFFRGEAHLLLAGYYMVPFAVLLVVFVLSDEPGVSVAFRTAPRLRFNRRRLLALICVCAVLGSSGTAYYAYFACFFLMLAGLIDVAAKRRAAGLLTALFACLLLALVVASNVAPTFIYARRHTEAAIAARQPSEAEFYGLKMAQLLLPVTNHRLAAFARLKGRYNHDAPLVNENNMSTLGAIASVGFLGVIGFALLSSRRRRSPFELFDHLGVLAVGGFLFGTIGGFGSLVSLLLFSQIRCYNRISVFLGFIGLAAVALVASRLRGKHVSGLWGSSLYCFCSICLVVLGIADQVPATVAPDYKRIAQSYGSDERFVARVESMMPARAMIFQLPYVRYPESPDVNRVLVHDLARGYLHSSNLRWSYGAVVGSASDRWQVAVVGQPTAQLVRSVASAGFAGLYIDTFGYSDRAALLQQELSALGGGGPDVVSEDHRLLFYDLHRFSVSVPNNAASSPPAPPLRVDYEAGFHAQEQADGRRWRWTSDRTAVLRVFNPQGEPLRATVELLVSTGQSTARHVQIRGPSLVTTKLVTSAPEMITCETLLPPGESVIELHTDVAPIDAPQDPRTMYLQVWHVSVVPQPAGAQK